ncbi:MAG: dicarboxylate/amino acid:cation symporter [Acidobacteria bacterium]|nr:dicarboxylate/amino acid:cation symporter [Acidobacteriota bacterium]MBU4307627.1 dicarboxylate/amino acid:cation symporter [Acidobacteriota bacterium]MBU4405524.1 dicarboxylate/amino acid:cation symporter [Acidobacteriota bacterium]MCG2810431.1 dicarboxylate/amino acid:cation symporter [Candidatus Aminicenantes bacterium]
MKMHTKIFIGLLGGAIVGSLLAMLKLGQAAAYIKPLGDLFIKLLKMITIPLIMVSIMAATAGFADLKKLGRVGLKGVSFFLISTIFAVSLGMTAANIFKPGQHLDPEKKQALMAEIRTNADFQKQIDSSVGKKKKAADFFLDLIPANPFAALAQGDMLAVITFSVLLGLAFSLIASSKREKVLELLQAVNDALIALVKGVMKLAPFAVFALIASVVTQFGFHFLLSLLRYSLVTIGVMAAFLFGYYGLAVLFLARTNPVHFFRNLSAVGLLAFSTSSSNAVLPENMISCEQKLGVNRDITSFILPLGATINMSGTSIYHGVSVVFIAQVFGYSLPLQKQLIIILSATLAAIGTAGIPGIGIITLALVLGAANIPAEGIGLIIGVERILDMCRTVLNVLGDSATALIVDRSEKRREQRQRGIIP